MVSIYVLEAILPQHRTRSHDTRETPAGVHNVLCMAVHHYWCTLGMLRLANGDKQHLLKKGSYYHHHFQILLNYWHILRIHLFFGSTLTEPILVLVKCMFSLKYLGLYFLYMTWKCSYGLGLMDGKLIYHRYWNFQISQSIMPIDYLMIQMKISEVIIEVDWWRWLYKSNTRHHFTSY